MADSVVGALRVLLGLDSAAFSSGLKGAESALNSFGINFKKLAGQLTIAAVAAKFTYDIKHMIDVADELGKASQKWGVPVETLSKLKFAADLADVSFESLGKGLGKLSKSMLEAGANPASEAAKSFQALGISATDATGKLRPTEDVFGDIAEKFSKMEDGAGKTAMAIRIFGRSGAELIPLLNEGRSGIKALTDEAQELGIVISKNTAARAQEFNDTLKRLGTVKDSIILKITEGMLPGLQQLASAMVATAKDTGTLNSAGASIIEGFNTLVHAAFATAMAINRVSVEWTRLNEVASTLPFTEARRQATEKYNKAIADTKRQFLELRATFSAPDPDALAWMGAPDAPKGKKNMDDLNLATLGAKSAIDSFINSQQKSQAATQADIATANAWIGTREGMRITMEAEAIALANNIILTDKQRAALKLLADQAQANAIAQAGIAMTVANLTPYEKLGEELRKISQLETENAISRETAHRARMKAENEYLNMVGSTLATAAGQFSQFFATFGKGNKQMFLLSKAFAITQAIISTMVAANKALELGPILGPIAMAGMIAAGMANVATIIAQKPPAMALGGAFQIGGAGGIDSRMVPIMATPGERVSVDQNKYGDSATSGRTITVQGVKPKDYYTGDVLRDIIDNINTAIGDGYKLKVA